MLHRAHVYKPYEPHLQLGEIGFGRSRDKHGLEANGIFPGNFLKNSVRSREVGLMYQLTLTLTLSLSLSLTLTLSLSLRLRLRLRLTLSLSLTLTRWP